MSEQAQEAGVALSEQASQGVRARRAFMLKQLIPQPGGAEWINTNVVGKGKGYKVTLGRVFGVATGYSIKNNTLPDGSPSSSIVLHGVFQAEAYHSGELSEATTVYLPPAYAEKVKTIFDTDTETKVVEVDVDIGLEATGKVIPYEWVVTAFLQGEEMAVLKRLRSSRARPADAMALAAPAKAAALPAPEPEAIEHAPAKTEKAKA